MNDVCDSCNNPDSTTSERVNPFVLEVHGEEVLDYLCDDCYRQLIEDI